jgi:hypothetical protein
MAPPFAVDITPLAISSLSIVELLLTAIPFPAVRTNLVSAPICVTLCRVPFEGPAVSMDGESGLLLSLSELELFFRMTKKVMAMTMARNKMVTKVIVMVVLEFEASALTEFAEEPMMLLHCGTSSSDESLQS